MIISLRSRSAALLGAQLLDDREERLVRRLPIDVSYPDCRVRAPTSPRPPGIPRRIDGRRSTAWRATGI